MPRIPYPDEATLPAEKRAMITSVPLNVVRMAALASTPIMVAQGHMSYALGKPEVIEPHLREVMVLRIATLLESEYELHQHKALARSVGLSQAQIDGVIAGEYNLLDDRLAAAARFTDELVRDVSPSDATQNALRKHLSDQQLVDMVLVAGHYMSLARLIAVTGPEIDVGTLDHLPSSADDHAKTR